MTPKFHTLKIAAITRETDDTVSLSFHIPSDLKTDYSYLSGQYLTLRTTINGEDTRRSYSLCSAPFESEVRVAIKKVENGVFSTYANQSLHVGDELMVMTPAGGFLHSPEMSAKKSYALFAAGSGITPVISIAKSVLHSEPASDVTLFYGNKQFGSIIFREELEALKNQYIDRLRVIHILSRESLGNAIQKGRIDREKTGKLFDAFLKNQPVDAVFVCGPEQMILAVKDVMAEKGVDPSAIHFELFTSGAAAKQTKSVDSNEPKVESNVTVILDGDELDLALDSTGDTILDAAQKAGADLPFACKGGVCCTCKAKIIEGTARMDVNYALEKDEVDAGYILTCQAHPTSEKLVVSFDD